AHLSEVLARAGVSAPRVDEMMEVDGRPGIVFGNLRRGETLSRAVRTRPWRIRSAARDLAQLHAAVHECSAPELPSQRERIEEQIRASVALSDEARSAALQALGELPDGEKVCHNDVHMLNVIVYPGGGMIIDWVLATRGSPLADVATAALQLRFGEQPGSFVGRWPLEVGRALFRRAYLRQYQQLRSCRPEELARWQLPAAAALSGRREGRMQKQLLECVDRLLLQRAA
ncbi:MAG TPA: phosphotransferase, partial [Gemmatimonadota bacterium]|nr:phosphotransferase [Gemmatimonadota bacterium]